MSDLSKAPDLSKAEYRALAYEDYNSIAYKSSLKGLLKGKGELDLLAQDALDARVVLIQLQTRILQRAWRFPIRYLPLILCRGPARSGANFLRWRNQENNRSGTLAWGEHLQSLAISAPVRSALLAIEHDRIIFNMQMSIVTFIIRQTRECSEKILSANSLAKSLPTSPSQNLRR